MVVVGGGGGGRGGRPADTFFTTQLKVMCRPPELWLSNGKNTTRACTVALPSRLQKKIYIYMTFFPLAAARERLARRCLVAQQTLRNNLSPRDPQPNRPGHIKKINGRFGGSPRRFPSLAAVWQPDGEESRSSSARRKEGRRRGGALASAAPSPPPLPSSMTFPLSIYKSEQVASLHYDGATEHQKQQQQQRLCRLT